MDIVGGILLADGTEAKVVTGVDDYSRFCVIAKVVARQTGRAVCLAFAEGMTRYGVPEEVLTDNGKQFTDRFGKGGEVLFGRICRTNGIIHRLTQPATPTTTGKVERFHQTLERELLDHSGVFADVAAAQAAIDAFVAEYNTVRPHQSLDMATPADRFDVKENESIAAGHELLPLRLPAFLTETMGPESDVVESHQVEVPGQRVAASADTALTVVWPQPDPQRLAAAKVSPAQTQRAIRQARAEVILEHGPVEFDRVVPGSGIVEVLGKQFWLHTTRAGMLVTFWAGTQAIHISVAGTRVKSARSHLSLNDLAVLTRLGARPAGPSPLPLAASGAPVTALELDRSLGTAGWVSVGNHIVKVNELGAGTRVGIRLDETTLAVFDLQTRELLRAGPNPLSPAEMLKLRGTRPAGPPPQPRTAPGHRPTPSLQQRRHLRLHPEDRPRPGTRPQNCDRPRRHRTLTVELDDGRRTIRRTTTQPVSKVKAQRPRKVTVI